MKIEATAFVVMVAIGAVLFAFDLFEWWQFVLWTVFFAVTRMVSYRRRRRLYGPKA